VPAKKRRSPQEKKRLSYSRDRRNDYGENDKSSRKNIARNKRTRLRAERHYRRQQLAAAVGPVDDDVEVAVQDRVTRPRHGYRWRKQPDVQLGLHIASALKRRAQKGSSPAETEQARIKKVLRNTAIKGAELRWARYTTIVAEPGVEHLQKCTTIPLIRASYDPVAGRRQRMLDERNG
jgi:hypothetical protein